MKEKDITASQYLQDKARTADLLNVGILHGKRLIRPEDIQERNSVSPIILPSLQDGVQQQLVQRFRDILCQVVCGCSTIFIGIENQDEIHYAMPIRTIGYDFSRYLAQYNTISKQHKENHDLHTSAEFLSGFSAQDQLEAVMTVVVYFGTEPWTGPRCLKDMLNLTDIPEELRECINDYPLHIIEAARLDNLEQFETDLKFVQQF